MAKILIVEDKRDERKLISDILTSANHKVTCVSNGEKALEFLLEERFNIVCLDQRLPGKSGTEIYYIIKSQHKLKKISIIFITAFDDDPEIQKLKDKGIPVIKKPIEYKEIINSISLALKKRVLIVEDREDDRKTLIDIFRLAGYDVSATSNAEQALRILQEEEFDLVVTDYALPDSTGEEFFLKIEDKLKEYNIPFLVTSIHGSKIDKKGLKKKGVHYIDKPFDPKVLLSKAKSIIK
ncbi:MAG: response regulator [Candidatus Hodarchaeota archaeon]